MLRASPAVVAKAPESGCLVISEKWDARLLGPVLKNGVFVEGGVFLKSTQKGSSWKDTMCEVRFWLGDFLSICLQVLSVNFIIFHISAFRCEQHQLYSVLTSVHSSFDHIMSFFILIASTENISNIAFLRMRNTYTSLCLKAHVKPVQRSTHSRFS